MKKQVHRIELQKEAQECQPVCQYVSKFIDTSTTIHVSLPLNAPEHSSQMPQLSHYKTCCQVVMIY